MRRTTRFHLAGSRWQTYALSAVRPSVEAALLAGVALGCAQIGWQTLAPESADASKSESLTSDSTTIDTPANIVSPFAPNVSGEAESHASAAVLASVKLSGIRMAANPARSGAVLTLDGGSQRAFLVGQEIASGVRLTEVAADYITVSYEGGSRQLALSAAPQTSFALALMGKAPPPATAPVQEPPTVAANEMADGGPAFATPFAPTAKSDISPVAIEAKPDEQAASLFASASGFAPAATTEPAQTQSGVPALTPVDAGERIAEAAAPADVAWLAATLGQVEMRDGAASGWRVAGPLPELAAAAGLRDGDLIVSVNGAGPENAAAGLATLGAGPVSVVVERDGQRETLTFSGRIPS